MLRQIGQIRLSACPSVCLSTCPSHSGIVSKRGNERNAVFAISVFSFLVQKMVDEGQPVAESYGVSEIRCRLDVDQSAPAELW